MMKSKILDIINQSKINHNTKNGLFLEKYIGYYNMPVRDNVILYESFSGEGMIDNPYGLFRAFMKRKDFHEYTHVWALKNIDANWFSIMEYSEMPNVIFVLYGSDEYLKYLSVSKYLINNCTFPTYFTKKDDQLYINTWHGKTIKKLGFDVPNSKLSMGNTIRNFLSANYILSPDDHMTSVYRYGYKLDGIYGGKIIQEGQPRNDLSLVNRRYVIEKLKSFGVEIDESKKIILYAPTWTGTLTKPNAVDYESVAALIDKTKYQFLYKSHHVNYKHKKEFIPTDMDTNELLSICDVLITDYSSIAYDFYNKPIIYYVPNHEEYIREHGLYYDLDHNVAYNTHMLKVYLNHIDDLKISHTDYSMCADKILSIILDGADGNVISFKNDKTKLLFYVGDFKPNGVTTSFMSLANSIDYNKYDVSLIALNKKDSLYERYINNINPNVRVLCRAGTYAQTILEESAKDITLTLGIGSEYLFNLLPREMYRREFKRCFGLSEFDKLINFTGYSPFYSYFFMCASGEKIVWQHNDMIADMNRETNGNKPLYTTLSVVFTTYPYYDKLVSASKKIMEVNKRSFPNIDPKKFKYAHNTLDYEKILRLSEQKTIQVDHNKVNFANNARLSYAKNQKELIKAFNIFSSIHPDCELYIIGDGELKEELLSIAGEHVHLVGFQENPYYLMAQCDYFVFPSLYEGQGISLLEARVLNLPIVVSDLPKMKGIFYRGGQYNIGGFDCDHIMKGLEKCYGGNVKPFNFDAKRYNDESYSEFERAICE